MAIPTLTLEYLEAISEYFMKGASEHLNSPLTEKCFEDPDFHIGWHICSAWVREKKLRYFFLILDYLFIGVCF